MNVSLPSQDRILPSVTRAELSRALRDELPTISYPFSQARHHVIPDFDLQLVLRIAEDLANALVYIGAVGEGAHCTQVAIRRVRSALTRKKPTPPLDDVLLFLISKYRKDGGGSLVKEIATATKVPEASVRRVLRVLESKGVAYRSPIKFANSYVWFYVTTTARPRDEPIGASQ